ncbi:MAG: sarcosine oxidase subunit gamma [Pseudonocardia sp.]
MPELRSPLTLAPTGVRSPLSLTDLSLWVKFQVRATPDGAVRAALGVPFGRTTRPQAADLSGTLVVGSGPGEWLVLGRPDAAALLRDALTGLTDAADEFASVVDVTHGRAMVRLSGGDAAAVLAKLCAVDLADAVTPDGSALRSSVAGVVTDVVRDDLPDGTPRYLLHCERSSGQYLADCLLDAGGEFDITVAAFDPTEDRP